ncbi:MAG: PhoX family protein [Candidatus Thiodiazotropha sp. (ex Monitilora ramsayi)]|nr:PhoX family protein [Candidatus Thiodiazotropha sp. (ex Monitilora ramsayi)]
MKQSLLFLAVLTSPVFGLTFEPVSLPDSIAEGSSIRGSQAYQHNGKQYTLDYRTLIRSGDRREDQIFGLLHDRQGNLIHRADGGARVSNKNDYSSLLQVESDLFMLTQFEEIPGAVYLSQLNQNPKTGLLKVERTRPLDLSSINGGWNHCAGSTTPWQTHLGTEEYEPNAAVRNENGAIDRYYQAMASYTGGDPKSLYPYDYGWQIEIRVDNFNKTRIDRRYAMGRLSHEVGLVMPDERTVYITDDAHNTAFFRFIADRPGDLSSGTLYAARWHQTGDQHGGQARIEWISLGHTDEEEIRTAMAKKPLFNDIFEHIAPGEDGNCPNEFSSINTRFGLECLKLIPGMERTASRLESRRFAALKGATTEFRKMEGLAFNPAKQELYVAITTIDKGMEDRKQGGLANTEFDRGGPNHIRLPFTPCGGIYALSLDKNYVATDMRAILLGETAEDDPENFCEPTQIANPDNLTFLTGHDTLIIAEDSSQGHINNMLWAFNLNRQQLTRLLTAPLGAEVTGSYYYPDINGWGYLMCTIQHPANGPATTGYLGPFELK